MTRQCKTVPAPAEGRMRTLPLNAVVSCRIGVMRLALAVVVLEKRSRRGQLSPASSSDSDRLPRSTQ